MRLIRFAHFLLLLPLLLACSSGEANSILPGTGSTDGAASVTTRASVGHLKRVQAVQSFEFDPATGSIELLPERSGTTHLDLAYFWKYYPGMLAMQVLEHDTESYLLTLEIAFTNPLKCELGDVRAMFPFDAPVVPVTFDGWTVRDGASLEKPDPYFAFGTSAPLRRLGQGERDTREITFKYKPPLSPKVVTFVLDAVVDGNTAEPYEFGEPKLTGRFFHVAISDWQDDVTSAFLDIRPCGHLAPLRLAPFGKEDEWGTSIPDITPGHHRVRLIAESPEGPGEDLEGEAVKAVEWIDLHWPPEDPIVPLPTGLGIYAYNFIDPDTNQPPSSVEEAAAKFAQKMGGDWLIMPYGRICNSGYLSMDLWVEAYVKAIHKALPDLPIHLNLPKMGFQPIDLDPCHHPPEYYTEKFFDHLLTSIRGQILENPDFDCISGIHFDIEIFPSQHEEDELFRIYSRYGDFLARLHLEPKLRGRNITLYEFDWHPHKAPGDLAYNATADAVVPECYFTKFDWDWDPAEYSTPYWHLRKMLGTYESRAMEYGRPYYPILGTFSGWFDGNQDTLGEITICGDAASAYIDEHCFGKGPLGTTNEFEILKAQDVHGMVVEEVVLRLPTGEQIFPASGLAVYRLGDGGPTTVGDDLVAVRTSYSVSRALQTLVDHHTPLMTGPTVFRFECNHSWKASALGHPLDRGDITCITGHIRFSDHSGMRDHPELWDNIRVELTFPLTPEILGNPAYRTSIDIVGVEDGSYILPDLPRDILRIRAVADEWESQTVKVDMRETFGYREGVDLVMCPVE